LLLAAACLAAPAVRAATPAEAPPKAPRAAEAPHPVQGLVVETGPGPAVKATYPAPGAVVPAGVLVLKVAFDQPMTPKAWAYGPAEGGAFPQCLADPRLLADQRTYVLLCTVSVGQAYAVQINPAPRFASAGGRPAQPYVLKFSTGEGDATRGLHDALAQAGLDDTADPIMTWRDPGKGVSQSAAE
jgi:hypothetical protein